MAKFKMKKAGSAVVLPALRLELNDESINQPSFQKIYQANKELLDNFIEVVQEKPAK